MEPFHDVAANPFLIELEGMNGLRKAAPSA